MLFKKAPLMSRLTWFGQRHHPGKLSPGRSQRTGRQRNQMWREWRKCPHIWYDHLINNQQFVSIKARMPARKPWPYEVFAEQWEGLLLVVAEHLEDDGLRFDVLHKRLGHFHCDLMGSERTSEQQHVKTQFDRWVETFDTSYILNVIEAQRGSPSRVLQRLSGESFIMTVDEAEKVKANISVDPLQKKNKKYMKLHNTGNCNGSSTTYLNWQKMSAYSAEMLEAWRTVTLKVNVLPIFRCDRAFWGDKSSGRSRLRLELLAGLLGVSKAASNTVGDYFLTNMKTNLKRGLQTVKNMNITLERHRFNSHQLSLGLWKQAVTHLDRCCCWPHLQRFRYLHSVLLPQRCAAPPGRCWSGKERQDTTPSGT